MVDDVVSFEYSKLNKKSVYLNIFFNEKEFDGETSYSVISFIDVGKSIQNIYKDLNVVIDKLYIILEEKYII
jgi:hypothetical protein